MADEYTKTASDAVWLAGVEVAAGAGGLDVVAGESAGGEGGGDLAAGGDGGADERAGGAAALDLGDGLGGRGSDGARIDGRIHGAASRRWRPWG